MKIEKIELLLANRDFVEAKRLLRGLLLRNKLNTHAMYLLSVAEAELGNSGVSYSILKKIVSTDPQYAVAHYTLAILLMNCNKHAEAMVHHDHAVKLLASNPWVFINRGISRAALHNATGAIDDFDIAIKLDSTISASFANKGNALFEINLFEESLRFLDIAIDLDPFNVDALSGKSACLKKLKRPEDALVFAERSLKLKPDHLGAWNNRGAALNDLKCYEEAIASYDRSIKLNPNHAAAWSNRGSALKMLKRYGEALVSCDRAIELKPDYAEAWSNRGVALNALKRHEEALANLTMSIDLKPEYAESWSNRGVVLSDLGRHEEALASYNEAVRLEPRNPDAMFNKGLLQLSQKQFCSGFENYLYRWHAKSFSDEFLQTKLPLCGPTSAPKRLLLWGEQGLGDEIFYSGMLFQAFNKFPSLSLIADDRLHPTFSRSFPNLTLLRRADYESTALDREFDAHAPVGDLGHILARSGEEIKASRKPFLIANPKRKSAFRSFPIFMKNKIVCGLSWESANKNFGNEKSIALRHLAPILRDPRVEFVNLQYGQVADQINEIKNQADVDIHQITGLDIYNDIDGLLALIDACDIVITTSNVTAHLAGSIGKRGCVLVPFSRGKLWYWHLNDAYSFWYPSLRVLYQSDRFDWSVTIRRTQDWIEESL